MKKQKIKIFLRTTIICTVVIMCIIFLLFSVCRIYENIRYIAYGEYKNAVEVTKDSIRILDFFIG